MAASDALRTPIKGKAYRVYGVIKSTTTSNLYSGGALADLACTIYKDGAAGAAAAATPVQIGTTGVVYCDLTAAEMDYYCNIIRFSSSTANTTDDTIRVYTAILDTGVDNVYDMSQPRFEYLGQQVYAYLFNKVTQDAATGTITVYKADDSTAVGTMSWSVVNNVATKGKLTG
jgi:hypothetical protein